MKIQRGDIVIANLETVSKGSVQKFRRPYLIISNNMANRHSPVVTALAMTSKTWKKYYLPTHCRIPAEIVTTIDEAFVVRNSLVLCEQIVSLDVDNQIEKVVARVTDKRMLNKITKCVEIQIGAYERYN